MRTWEELPVDAAIAAGIDAFASAFETEEPKRMLSAFINRRRD
jgi:enoyl-CoA hydratase